MRLTKKLAQKVLETVDAGLVQGLGKPVPGQMCVEAAVCFALGEPHGDKPSCVGAAVRVFKIRLNDAKWLSNEARAEGLRELAIAQLGSDKIDQKEFAKRIALLTIQELLPRLLRLRGFEKEAIACEQAKTLEEGKKAARAAAAADATYAAAAAAYAADAYAAAAAVDADAAATGAAELSFLQQSAAIGVRVLKELKSPGTKWLFLCEAAK